MSAATLRTRIDRLADQLQFRNPDDCDGPPTLILDAGEPVPDDADRCPQCGSAHVLVIEEQIAQPASEGGGPCET
jgi:hypothetical protein